MGIFSRFSEIVNSNVNAMLDKAENPEKMVKLMIHEMEETLMEVKTSAAEVVADQLRTQREFDHAGRRAADWEYKAELAITKGRDDLAREALEQKAVAQSKLAQLETRLTELNALAANYQADIANLEEKLSSARNRQQILIANHHSAVNRKRVEEKIYKLNTTGAFAKFEQYERRIDRFNAEAQILSVSNTSLEKKFRDLDQENKIQEELERLKTKAGVVKAEKEAQALAATPS